MMVRSRWCWPLLALLGAVVCLAARSGQADEKDGKSPSKTKPVEMKGLTLTVPESWEFHEPTNQFRLGSFTLPKAEGVDEEAELVVFSFAGGGGGVRANIDRWIKQFESQGRKAKVTTGESPKGKYVLVDVTGTYNMPVGPPIRQQTKKVPDARMMAAILNVEDQGVFYLKLAGPQKTIDQQAAAFRQSFGADAAKEQEVKLGEPE